jgi:hypothetical protein
MDEDGPTLRKERRPMAWAIIKRAEKMIASAIHTSVEA